MRPYFALRSYRDAGEHYDAQIGSEPTPQAFLEALWSVLSECWRVLKPTGSCWVNLGDKRSGSGGHNNAGISSKSTLSGNGHVGGVGKAGPTKIKATLRNAPDRYNQAAFGRTKSKMLLPHRFAIGCEDGLADPEGIGWIVRQDVVWSKRNSLPESVTDRTRDSHEFWFHLTKQGRYFSAVDEIRQPSVPQNGLAGTFKRPKPSHDLVPGQAATQQRAERNGDDAYHPKGALPGSVWTVASEPLRIPDAVKAHYDLPDHFAAFPQELPRRIILGWSPSGICVECGEGRRPVVIREFHGEFNEQEAGRQRERGVVSGAVDKVTLGRTDDVERTITGYACACPPCGDCSRTLRLSYDKTVSPVRVTDNPRPPKSEVGVGSSTGAQEGSVLLQGMFESLERGTPGVNDVSPADDSRIRGTVEAESPDGEQGRVHHGAPLLDGGAPRAAPDLGRGRASQERDQDGQPARKPRSPAKEGPRPPAEAAAEAVSVPSLSGLVTDVREPQPCPHCRPAPTRASVILDPFSGTGTVPGVARQLGRFGVGIDLSFDYLRLARWFLDDGRRFSKTSTRTDRERQGVLL